jgi:hypothetical protein
MKKQPSDDSVEELDFAVLSELRGDGEGPLDHPCPLCGPERQSETNQQRKVLRTWETVPGRITFYCARCEAKGSAQANTTQMLRPRKLRPARPPPENKAKLAYVEKLWAQAVTPLPKAARAYFRWRGISLDDVPPGALRLLWHCPWEGDTQPCVVARYTDALTGQPKGLWRRSLEDRAAKPMTMGPQAGCVIRLWPQVGARLVVGEGVETTLAAATRIIHRELPLQPAWATGCAGNMRRLPVLDGVEHLILLVDNDISGTGQAAAEVCAKRWCAAGRKVTRLIPNKSQTDFNDLVRTCQN